MGKLRGVYCIFQIKVLYCIIPKQVSRSYDEFVDILDLWDLHRLNKIMTWISNYLRSYTWDAITHPYPNFNGELNKLTGKLVHGLVITSHSFTWMYLNTRAVIAMLF